MHKKMVYRNIKSNEDEFSQHSFPYNLKELNTKVSQVSIYANNPSPTQNQKLRSAQAWRITCDLPCEGTKLFNV